MHDMKIMLLMFFLLHPVACMQFPFMQNVALIPRFLTNFTTVYNSSCDQCLCSALKNTSAAVNCFSNNTCQLFSNVPTSYRLQNNTASILYFTGASLPSPSQCCMSNTTLLIQKLQNATIQSIDLLNPRCLVIDDHGFLVTAQERQLNLSRFNPYNLSLIDSTTFSGYPIENIAYHQGAYFLTTQNNTILIVNSTNLTLINTITASGFNGVRDIIFLKDGQIMIVASSLNKTLLFFERSNGSLRNYTYAFQVNTSFNIPHGLTYVNDALFYATAWESKNIYSFATSENGTWTEKLFVNATDASTVQWGAHVMIDGCQRRWFSTSNNGLLIYDTQGQLLGNFNSVWNGTFDAIFMDNYAMLLSDRTANKIIRLDPQIQC